MLQWGWFWVVTGGHTSLPSNFLCPQHLKESFRKSPALCLHTKFILRRWQEGVIILDNSVMLLRTIFFPVWALVLISLTEKMNLKITPFFNTLIVNINSKRLNMLHWNQPTLCQTYFLLPWSCFHVLHCSCQPSSSSWSFRATFQ